MELPNQSSAIFGKITEKIENSMSSVESIDLSRFLRRGAYFVNCSNIRIFSHLRTGSGLKVFVIEAFECIRHSRM